MCIIRIYSKMSLSQVAINLYSNVPSGTVTAADQVGNSWRIKTTDQFSSESLGWNIFQDLHGMIHLYNVLMYTTIYVLMCICIYIYIMRIDVTMHIHVYIYIHILYIYIYVQSFHEHTRTTNIIQINVYIRKHVIYNETCVYKCKLKIQKQYRV